MLPKTTERVKNSTSDHVNEQIRAKTLESVQRYASARPEEISRRLDELDREWDIERTLEANASVVAFLGVILGWTVHLYWLALPILVTSMLLLHALQGWCPPMPIFRRLSFRTASEIDTERYALKVMRGDFDGIAREVRPPAATVLSAVEA